VYSVCATKKLLDRVKEPARAVVEPTTVLGNWYATAIFTRPQAALFVNEQTLLPVFLPLAPARDLWYRFPAALSEILWALGVSDEFCAVEFEQMKECVYSATQSRSVLGVMNEFVHSVRMAPEMDFFELSLAMSYMPCGPLFKRHVSPDDETVALLRSKDIEVGARKVPRR